MAYAVMLNWSLTQMPLSGLAKTNILVVDDNEAQLTAVEAILAPLRQNVVLANSGAAALRAVLKGDFAVILLDVRMEGMGGLETAKLIKSREKTRLVPIIFLTGMDSHEEALMSAYSMGAVDYILKPVHADILRSKVSVFVDLYRQQQRIVLQERQLRDSDRRRLEFEHARELLQSEMKYREILAAALDAIIVFDANGKVTMINAAAAQMFGVPQDQALGQPITSFVPSGIEEEIAPETAIGSVLELENDVVDTVLPRRIAHPRALTARRSSGEDFPIETSITCLSGATGRTYTLIARDVSERVRSEQELRRVNQELRQGQLALEEAIAARSRFFASMSHELRTPINAMLGYTSLLSGEVYGPLNEQQREGVQRAEKATRHLLDLVNDVLDLSKIEAGKIDLEFEEVHVPDLIRDLFITVQPLADEHGSTLTLEQKGESLPIRSDSRRVRQILFNLLSNAIKFGDGKPIQVIARSRMTGRFTGVAIDVVDHGIGIDPANQERIFEEFEQVRHGPKQAGTGLGLAISRRLANMLGGSLTLNSKPKKGSKFTLILPASVDVIKTTEVVHAPLIPVLPAESHEGRGIGHIS